MDFDEHFAELAGLAYQTAFRIVGSQAEAEDVAQETLAKALTRWKKIAGHARPWVCRVAGNEAIGIVRKRRPLPDGIETTPDQTMQVHNRLEVQRLLLALPRRQREVVVLRYIGDLSEADTAAELGLSIGAVKTHAHRGLKSLRLTVESNPVDADPKVVFDV